VKRNLLVELYIENYNIEYGLVNGVYGALKYYSKKKKRNFISFRYDFLVQLLENYKKKSSMSYITTIFHQFGDQYFTLKSHSHALEEIINAQYKNNSQYRLHVLEQYIDPKD
jgi:hypothetical protein